MYQLWIGFLGVTYDCHIKTNADTIVINDISIFANFAYMKDVRSS